MTVKTSGAAGTVDQTLESRYADVKQRVAAAAKAAGRKPSDIVIVAVTKFAEADQIRALIQLGTPGLWREQGAESDHADRDDRRVHGAAAGAPARGASRAGPVDSSIRWHMIGHLQRNKAKKAVELCRLIHSVDSLRLAEEVQSIAAKREEPVDVLVQVNCSGEKSKFGCPPPAALHLAEQIDTMLTVRVRGLMTMAALDASPGEVRETFGSLPRAVSRKSRRQAWVKGSSTSCPWECRATSRPRSRRGRIWCGWGRRSSVSQR
jgi:uncharacterized pyridoxal phosphate-containing UPF0001 family protein